MKRIAIIILLLPHVSTADDPFACVDPDIREAFLPAYPTTSQYSTELPVGFVEHSVPPSFVLIGSQANDASASAVYKAVDNIDAAISDVVTSLEEHGWREFGDVANFARRGFQVSAIPRYSRLCRDAGPGMLTIGSKDTSGVTFVTISMTSLGGVQSCGDLVSREHSAMRHMALAQEMPELRMPQGVRSINAGSGGGGADYQTSTVVSTDFGRESLVSFLNDQIRDQGWNFDGAWSGSRSSGTAWFKESAEGDLIIGTLRAFGDSGDTFNLRFSINVADTERYAGQWGLGVRLQ